MPGEHRVSLVSREVRQRTLADDSEDEAEAHLRTTALNALSSARLRRRTPGVVNALSVGVVRPPRQDEDPAPEATAAASSSSRCCCLRRSGRCTCDADDQWLSSKRQLEAKTYVPPYRRQAVQLKRAADVAGLAEREKTSDSSECTCLRRNGRCTCVEDAAWIQRKRQRPIPYLPPHLRQRQDELEAYRQARDSREEEAPAPASPNIRMLARRWKSQLESIGACRFNPLQMDNPLKLLDTDGLVLECPEQSSTCQGVKALPMVRRGAYQFEVEFLRDASVVVGWSSAMTLPCAFDGQAFGFRSDGNKVNNQQATPYGPRYGKRGDILGALIKWSADGVAVEIAFMLNGELLGVAFNVGSGASDTDVAVPLQPHVCQLPDGPLLHLRLRGSRSSVPLRYAAEGYTPLADIDEQSFCPFSQAAAIASSERLSAALSEEQLATFQVPDAHVAVADVRQGGALVQGDLARDVQRKMAALCGAKRSAPKKDFQLAPDTITGGAQQHVLVAFRRAAQAEAFCQSPLQPGAKMLREASIECREKLAKLRGEEFRPRADPTVARRLIHASIAEQMPLAHLAEEKSRHAPAHAASDEQLRSKAVIGGV
eukprot:TRINITY_DN70578_c0_g1_i1.p1 TRINITY_DN70578_c0_g1~~TRINITY_DN70578_c0_g1_i1.p1  ORF type:complete len:599 (+),score=119.81 TRINITY_DN70578_c0_g1_i1:72-1868(+)